MGYPSRSRRIFPGAMASYQEPRSSRESDPLHRQHSSKYNVRLTNDATCNLMFLPLHGHAPSTEQEQCRGCQKFTCQLGVRERSLLG